MLRPLHDDPLSPDPHTTLSMWGAFLANLDEGLFAIDRTWRFTFVNRHVAQIWNRSEAELLGKVMWDAFPTLIGSPFEALYRQAMVTGTPARLEAPTTLNQRWYDVRLYPFPEGLIAYIHDITARKQLENTLQILSDAAFEALIIHDTTSVIEANRAAAQLYGYSPEEFIGLTVAQLVAPESQQLAFQYISTGSEDVYETIDMRKDGSRFPVEIRARNVIYQGQKMRVAAIRDISERRRAEAQRVEMAKMESSVRLVAGIAHNFNNALNVIMTSTQLAQMSIAPDTPAYTDLQASIQATERAAGLVQQLLTFARVDLPSFEAMDLNGLLLSIDALIRTTLSETITFVFVPSRMPLPVFVDSARIERVVLTLVTNACDALPEGGTITLEVGQTRDIAMVTFPPDVSPGVYAFITIHDTGIGMDADTHDHLFEPFFTTKAPDVGIGLGLAVAYSIVKEHGGWITGTGTLNEGSTFTVYLPLNDS